jgi:hypothetical protein
MNPTRLILFSVLRDGLGLTLGMRAGEDVWRRMARLSA